jgi:hypothetical protein
MDTLGEAARLAHEASQIMTQLGIVAFEPIGFRLVTPRLMSASPAQFFVNVEGIREVARRLWSSIHNRLH